jgi:hypothetical protein
MIDVSRCADQTGMDEEGKRENRGTETKVRVTLDRVTLRTPIWATAIKWSLIPVVVRKLSAPCIVG